MSQSNKRSKSKIFIIIFALIAIVITGFLIWYTLINNIDTADSNSDAFYISTEKTSEGLNTYDTYDENAITIEEIEDEIDEVTVSYVQIDGLIDEEIENKINQEIKDLAYGYDAEKTLETCSFYVSANYANVLSIEGYYLYAEEETEDYVEETKTLNYDLTTGEQIEFYDLFVSESAGLSVVRDSAYIKLADVYSDEARTDDDNWYDPDMSTIDYGEIEEDLNYVVLCYRNNKIEKFYFSEQQIYFWIDDGNGDDEAYSIDMADFLENIAIYNRYSDVSAEEIYEDPSISIKDLYVLTYRDKYTTYEIVEETDNYYIYLYTYDVLEDISVEGMELLKLKIEEMATEIKELAESDGKFYVVSCNFSGFIDGDLLEVTESKEMAICELSNWSAVKDKLLEDWRETNTAEYLPTSTIGGLGWDEEEEEDLYTWSDATGTFLYDLSSGEEIIPTDDEAEEELRYHTQDLIYYENLFETEEDENGNLEITNWWDYDYIFTDNGFEIYEQNAIEQGYVKYEEVYITEDDEEEGYYEDKYYLTQQDEYQFGNIDLFLEDYDTFEIEILEKSSSKITANVTVKFFKDEECKNEYEQAENTEELNLDDICDEVTIEIELNFTGYEWEDGNKYTTNWEINNYSIL